MLRPATRAAVEAQVGGEAVFLADPGGGMFYADLLRRLFREPGDLVICEQDVVPPPGAIAGLLACDHYWCGHLLPFEGRFNYATLGLAKFSAELKRRLPAVFDYALARPPWLARVPCLKPGEVDPWAGDDVSLWPSSVGWPRCDILILRELETRGLRWHRHDPPVVHLHGQALT
jgi:hypothetical protein